jgi:hypothetical protein
VYVIVANRLSSSLYPLEPSASKSAYEISKVRESSLLNAKVFVNPIV